MISPNPKPKIEYITRTGLRGKRGWTDLLMNRFLPAPDKIADNPYYKSAGQVQLWELEKIYAIEQTAEFKVMMQSAADRKHTANKAIRTKKKRIISYVNSLVIEVPEMPEDKLVNLACDSYNNHKSQLAVERGYDFDPATPDSDEQFLNRICTNFLRHQCTRYERELERIFGKVGTQEAYALLKDKVNSAIFNKYPFLINERYESESPASEGSQF